MSWRLNDSCVIEGATSTHYTLHTACLETCDVCIVTINRRGGGLSNSVSVNICLVDCMYIYIVYIYKKKWTQVTLLAKLLTQK